MKSANDTKLRGTGNTSEDIVLGKQHLEKLKLWPGIVAHTCNVNIQEGRAGGPPQVWGQPGLQNELKGYLNYITRPIVKNKHKQTTTTTNPK